MHFSLLIYFLTKRHINSRSLRSGELSPEFCRGQLNTLWQLSITTGILLVSIMNIWLQDWKQGWRISYAGNILFAVIMSAMLLIMPESPRYLVAEGRADEAKAALAKVRFEDQLEWELENVTRDVKHLVDLGKPSWGEIFSSNNNMGQRVGLGMALQMWQQLCGKLTHSIFSQLDNITAFSYHCCLFQ